MSEVYQPDRKSEECQAHFQPKYAVKSEAPQGMLTKGSFNYSSSTDDAGGSTGRDARTDKFS